MKFKTKKLHTLLALAIAMIGHTPLYANKMFLNITRRLTSAVALQATLPLDNVPPYRSSYVLNGEIITRFYSPPPGALKEELSHIERLDISDVDFQQDLGGWKAFCKSPYLYKLKEIDISNERYDDRRDVNAFLKLLSCNTSLHRLVSINAQNTNITLDTLAALRNLEAHPHFIRDEEKRDLSGRAILPLIIHIQGDPAWNKQWMALREIEKPSTKRHDVFYTSYQEFGSAQIKLDIIE